MIRIALQNFISLQTYLLSGASRSASLASLVVLLVAISPCHAAFIVLGGNNPQPNQENVLLPEDDMGLTIFGSTQSGKEVSFTSPTQFLIDPSGGQAKIEARAINDANSAQVDINDSITLALTNPNLSFSGLIFNAPSGSGSLSIIVNGFDGDDNPANATITLDDDSDPLTLGNGSNFFTVLANAGFRMTSVEISPNVNSSYEDLRQVRISGIIPEPATVMLVGMAMLGLLGGYRSRRSVG
jgi:hypothetical protein